MTEPYRTADEARGGVRDEQQRLDAELQRLAEVGQQRRSELETAAALEKRTDASRHLRIAIGAYRGSAMKRVVLAIGTCVGLAVIVLVHLTYPVLDLAIVLIVLFGLGAVTFILPPLASEGAVAAEARWVASLPFPLEGYFEVLSGTPQVARSIVYDLSWSSDQAPDTTFLENVVAGIDPKARVEEANARGARVIGGPISGLTNVKESSRSYATSNHRIPAGVHGFVDQVLSSLHRRYPLARVSLTSR
jgi:hypothetical protein